jgi:hypothetical protein
MSFLCCVSNAPEVMEAIVQLPCAIETSWPEACIAWEVDLTRTKAARAQFASHVKREVAHSLALFPRPHCTARCRITRVVERLHFDQNKPFNDKAHWLRRPASVVQERLARFSMVGTAPARTEEASNERQDYRGRGARDWTHRRPHGTSRCCTLRAARAIR